MKNKGNDELRNMLGKLLGMENVPDDCVIQAMLNDQRLQKLAEYDVTKGYTNLKVEPEQLQERFTEFKQTVLKKSSTLAELETTVFTRWGVLEKPRNDMPLDQMTMPDVSKIHFTDVKPITGFAPEKRKEKKGDKTE
jgi:hypothetical protein